MPVGLDARRRRASGGAARRKGTRLAAAFALCTLAAVTTSALGPAHTSITIAPVADASVAQETVSQVVAAMDLAQDPVSYVILIDVSGSMVDGGLFGSVQNALPGIVSAMKPDDTVAVDTFGNTAQQVLGPTLVGNGSAADAAFKQVSVEPAGNTDTGSGLLLAYNQLYGHTPQAKIGVVLLLTDGKPDVPVGQSPYALPGVDTESSATTDAQAIDASPQWQKLHSDFNSLTSDDGMTVIGGGVALRPGLDLSPVLDGVFADAYVDSNPDISTLLTFIQGAQGQARTAQAAKLLDGDLHARIAARLSGTGLSSGRANLAAGSTPATLTLTSNAAYAPLVLSNAAVTITSGMPLTVSGLPSDITVAPGAQVSLPVVLHWQPPNPKSLLAGPVNRGSTLTVGGQTTSPWAASITAITGKAFAPAVTTNGTMQFAAGEPGQADTGRRAEIALVLLLLVGLWFASRIVLYPSLRGMLDIRIGVSDHDPVALPSRRKHKIGSITVAGQTAEFTVRSVRRIRRTELFGDGTAPTAIRVKCKTLGPSGTTEKRTIEAGESRHLCNSWKVHYVSDPPSAKAP